jgi:hypothetical protein
MPIDRRCHHVLEDFGIDRSERSRVYDDAVAADPALFGEIIEPSPKRLKLFGEKSRLELAHQFSYDQQGMDLLGRKPEAGNLKIPSVAHRDVCTGNRPWSDPR